MASAALDRLTHHIHFIDLKDEASYRQRERKEDLSLSGKSEQDVKNNG